MNRKSIKSKGNTTFIETYLKIYFLFAALILLNKVLLIYTQSTLHPMLTSYEGFVGLARGIKLDLAALSIVTIPVTAYMLINSNTKAIKTVSILTLTFISFTTLAGIAYYTESGRHLTFEVHMTDNSIQGLASTLFTTYLTETSITIVLLSASILVCNKIIKHIKKPSLKSKSIFIPIWLIVSITFIRGGWVDAPQSPMHAYKIGNKEIADIAWNSTYAITYYLFKGTKNSAIKISNSPNQKDFKQITPILSKNKKFISPQKQANIIIVLLESWNAIDMHSYGNKEVTTPNFDEFRDKSLTTDYFYADGYRTVEGMFSIFCSYPNPIGGGVAGTQLQLEKYNCLPEILKQSGWETVFIQGSGKGIVGAFAQSLGFEKSFGKTDYKFKGTHNHWGYMDDDIYKFSLDIIQNTKQPFLISINTGTTHDTYLPNESDYTFGKNDSKSIRQSTLNHADKALGSFLTKLQKTVDENTLIVLVADHTARLSPSGISQNTIPFSMHAYNGSIEHKKIAGGASQVDISPTIIDWLGGHSPWFVGSSLLNGRPKFAQFSRGTTATWIEQNLGIEIDASKDELTNCFTISQNGFQTNKLQCTDNTKFGQMYEHATSYIKVTQQLLFDGKTAELNKP